MSDVEPSTARIEAFSDGVFAIAITLLVLEFKVPHPGEGPLLPRLLSLWPAFGAYLTSFATIGVMWINHHHMCSLLRRVDHGALLWNLGLLMCVSFVPFPTATLAEHLDGRDGCYAGAFYGITYICIALMFNGLWGHLCSPRREPPLLRHPHDHPAIRAVTNSYRIGPLAYLAITGLAFASPRAGLAASLLLAGWWAVPIRPRQRT